MLPFGIWKRVIKHKQALGQDPFAEHCRDDLVGCAASRVLGARNEGKASGVLICRVVRDPSSGNAVPSIKLEQ